MTQRHAMRRGVKPRPSDKDIRVLERLLKRAAPLGADPFGPGMPFVIAAEKANKAILPVALQDDPKNPFSRLIRLAKTFLALSPADRMAAGPGIAQAVAEARAALDAPAPVAVKRPKGEARLPSFRRDIDG